MGVMPVVLIAFLAYDQLKIINGECQNEWNRRTIRCNNTRSI
jgi:hypothetical protein